MRHALLIRIRRRTLAALAVGLVFAAAAAGLTARVRAEGAAAAARAVLRGKKVALDPGHGGVDPGAVGYGVREAEVVLPIALRLRDLLTAAGARVLITRVPSTDFSQYRSRGGMIGKLGIEERMATINAWHADVLINIHANSFRAIRREHGAQTFYMATGAPGSRELALLIQHELVAQTGETRRRASTRIRHYMLRKAEMPAVTVEVGFLSNPREARLLAEPPYQAKLAQAMFAGLVAWFRQRAAAQAPGA